MRFLLLITFVTALLLSCSSTKNVQFTTNVAAPNYSNNDHWASLPSKKDPADLVPVNSLKNEQETAKVDVFFVHPTTFTKGDAWNVSIDNQEINDKTDDSTIKLQASVFNGSGRIYAPRYRQANLKVFYKETGTTQAKQALDLAYEDVKTAFQYYLDNYNDKRPIIIASHSQGTLHATKLVKEFFDNPEWKDRLVAAYLVGYPVRPNDFTYIEPCKMAAQTNCYVSWNTKGWNFDMTPFYKDATATNPINWTIDGTYASREENKGGVLKGFDEIKQGINDAQTKDGVIWIHKPKIPFAFLYLSKNYHVGDYNLFWMNVRENVAERVANYLK
ncbi:MAG: DUF3089 domain-containing protein [Chitinophagales bacterium]